MKKILAIAVVSLVALGSCAQKAEKREEFKEEHDKTEMRNQLGDSAVAASPVTTPVDTASAPKKDSLKR